MNNIKFEVVDRVGGKVIASNFIDFCKAGIMTDKQGKSMVYVKDAEIDFVFKITTPDKSCTFTSKGLNEYLDTQVKETPESVWASIVDGLEKKEDRDKYPASIFWFKNGLNYFEYDEKSKYFWCRYALVWSVFESKFKWEHKQTQTFIEGKVEEHFKLKGVTARNIVTKSVPAVEEHFKLKDTRFNPSTRESHS